MGLIRPVLAALASLPLLAAAPQVAPQLAPPVAPRPGLASDPISRMALPWWRERFEAKQARLRQGNVALAWYGDSITENWERAGPPAWEDYRPAWVHFYGGRQAVDLGFKGDTTASLIWRLDHGETTGIAPRVAVVLIGANDFGHTHWDAAQTLGGIETVIDILRRDLPRTHLILLGVLPSIRSAWISANTAALNRALAARYEGRDPAISYVDVSDLFLRDGHVDPERFIDPRLTPPDPPLHPTAQVQAEIALRIEPIVARYMGDQPRGPFPSSAR